MSRFSDGPWLVGRADKIKGDWTCHDDDASCSTWKPIIGPNGKPIAFVVDSCNTFDERESFEADCALIAAAPELLAALNEIVANDPFNQSSAGIIARKAIAAVQP